MLGLGLEISLEDRGPPAVPLPTLASLNYALFDPLGGGADIVATGTNLAGATAVTVGGTTATITDATATTVTFTPPAKAAGTYDVVVTTPDGEATLAASLESWAPASEASCTYLCERPDYAVAGSAGTWTRRVGGANLTNDPGPPATSGAPNFDGTGHLLGPTLTTLHGTGNFSHFAVLTHTNTQALVLTGGGAGGVASNPFLTTNGGNGAIGLAAGRVSGTPSVLMQVAQTGPGNSTANAPAAEGAHHAVIGAFDSTVGVSISVDGAAFTSPVGGAGVWGSTGGALKVGARYDDSRLFRGEVRALGILNVTASATFRTKFYAWARQRHGVA